MSRISRTVVWLEDKEGQDFYLKPLAYSKDKALNKVLIAELQNSETERQIAQHAIIPLLIPKNFKGEETEVRPVKCKQDFSYCFHRKIFKADELSFNVNFTDYKFFVKQNPSFTQKILDYICEFLEELREKNPGFYDLLVSCASYIWECIAALITYFTGSVLFLGISVCCLYGVFILFQIGSERNKTNRLLEEKEKECEAKIKKYEVELSEAKAEALEKIRQLEDGYKKSTATSLIELVTSEHEAAHNGKLCTVDMANLTNIVDSSSKLIEFLKKCVNSLEQQLSSFYQCDVCASFKMVDSETELRTCARGNNNIKLRGLIGESSSFESPVKISDNTAYTHIFKEKHNCFHNGNLIEYNKKRKKKTFKCEYKNWQDYFVSTIVIPIRWHVSTTAVYKIAALICVDCKKPLNDWNSRDSFGYHLVAFYADLLYTPLRDYHDYRWENNEGEGKD